MRAMSSHIKIGDHTFKYVHSVSITSSWKLLSDKATIKLPNIAGQLKKQIKAGDLVYISLGYDGDLVEEFIGYVSKVHPTTPLTIECMDDSWNLQQDTISKSWKSIKLDALLAEIVGLGTTINVPDITLAPFRLDKVTVLQALQQLKKMYGLVIYYREEQLYAGLAYGEEDLEPVVYRFNSSDNTTANAVATGLKFRSKEDVKVKVKAISLLPDNTRYELELGDKTGEIHTLHFYDLTEKELKQQAEDKINKLKYDGLEGTFMAFGQPVPRHSAVCKLRDDKYPEREGDYFIDQVVTNYGPGGFHRTITPGRRADSELIQAEA